MNNSVKNICSTCGLFTLALLLLYGISGCADSNHLPPPVDRSKLVLRLFKSMRNSEINAAINQAEKLEDITDSVNRPFLKRIIYTQNANRAISEAQEALNNGSVTDAALAIHNGLNASPNNPVLVVLTERLDEQAAVARLAVDLEKFQKSPIIRKTLIADLQRRLKNSPDDHLRQASNRLATTAEIDGRFRNLRLLTANYATFEILNAQKDLNVALYTTILAERELESNNP